MRHGILRGREKLELLDGALFAALLPQPGFATVKQATFVATAQNGAFSLVVSLIPCRAFGDAAKAHLANFLASKAANLLAGILDGEIFELVHCGSCC